MGRIFFLLPCLFLLASCASPEKGTQVDVERIAAERRFREVMARGTLRVAVCSSQTRFAALHDNGFYSGPEVETLRKAASAAKLRLFLFDVRPEALPGYIRTGKADLGIGGLRSDAIRGQLLLPVMEYSEGGKQYAFAVWNDGLELKNLLENGLVKQK